MNFKLTGKQVLAGLISITFLLIIAGCKHDHEKIVKTYKLAPKAKQRITFESDHETTLSFNADVSAADKDKMVKGFRVSHVNAMGEGEALTSKSNLHVEVAPEKGKISVLVENLEKIPIKLFVSWKGK